MSTQRGKFIVFEGIDGCGKTTQVRELMKRLGQFEINCTSTREASDGPIGTILRNTYLSGKRRGDPRVVNMIYVADRLDHLTNTDDGIVHTLNSGSHVICDRYYMSSMAYDPVGVYGTPDYEREMKFIMDLNRINREILEPDITFFLRIDPHVAIDRLMKDRVDDGLSIYESYDTLEKLSKIYEDCIRILRSEGQNIFCIDATLDWNDVLDIVCYKLAESGIIPGVFQSGTILPGEWLRGD